jgi:hypothetical protein
MRKINSSGSPVGSARTRADRPRLRYFNQQDPFQVTLGLIMMQPNYLATRAISTFAVGLALVLLSVSGCSSHVRSGTLSPLVDIAPDHADERIALNARLRWKFLKG